MDQVGSQHSEQVSQRGHLLLICFLLIGTLLLPPGAPVPRVNTRIGSILYCFTKTLIETLVLPLGPRWCQYSLCIVAHFVLCCSTHPFVMQLCHPMQISVQSGLLPIQKSIARMQMVAHKLPIKTITDCDNCAMMFSVV